MTEEMLSRIVKVIDALQAKKEVRLTVNFDTVEPPSEVFEIVYKDGAYYAQLMYNLWRIEEYHRFVIKEIV